MVVTADYPPTEFNHARDLLIKTHYYEEVNWLWMAVAS